MIRALCAAPVLAAILAVSAGAQSITGIQTLPGGSEGQLQFKQRGQFAGVQGSTVAGSQVSLASGTFGTGATRSTFTATGALNMASGAAITLSGAAGVVTGASSMTASAFFGDGSKLTGLVSTAAVAAADAALAANLVAHTLETSTHGATSANTASRIVMRDGSGNFSAGTVTANLTGNVTGNLTGNVTGNADTATALAANGTNASSGRIVLGVDAAGNAETGHVETTGNGVSGSTSPASAGALYTAWASRASSGTDNSLTRADVLANIGTSLIVTGGVTATTISSAPRVAIGGAGSSSAADLFFSADSGGDTGAYLSGDDIRFTIDGTDRGSIVGGLGVCGGSGASTGQPCLRSTTSPGLSDTSIQYVGDINTGILRWAADSQAIVNGGVASASFTATAVHILPGTANTSTFTATAGAAGLAVSSLTVNSSGAANPYGVTIASGARISTGKLAFGSGGFIQFSDGTTQVTAPSASSVHTSSVAAYDTVAYTGNTLTAYGACLANSSVTFSGTCGLLGVHGDFYKVTTGKVFMRWIVDGATVEGGKSPYARQHTNDAVKAVDFIQPVCGLSAGAHTACLQYYNEGSGTFRPYTGNSEYPEYWAQGSGN